MGDYSKMGSSTGKFADVVVGVLLVIILAAFAAVANQPQYNLSAITLLVIDFLPVGLAIGLLIKAFKN